MGQKGRLLNSMVPLTMDFRAPLQRTHPPKPLNDAQTGRLLTQSELTGQGGSAAAGRCGFKSLLGAMI